MSELIGLKAPVQPQAPADVIIDGTEAVTFLKAVKTAVEDPNWMLLG